MTIEIEKDASFFWWRLKGRNGRILATSEGYGRGRDAARAARKVGAAINLKVVDRTKK
jgi:uncharacterized protein YegP (UPF0339 family)